MKVRNKILIVDDESHGRQLFEAILIEEGYELIFANDGPGAMNYLHECIPDLIILDVMMPGMDGFEVCRKIRIDKSFKGIPIILVTALDDRDSRKKGLAAGATDYISKPFDRNEIQAKIRNLLRLNPASLINAETELSGFKISDLSDLTTLTEQVFNQFLPVPDYLRLYLQDFFFLTEGSEVTKTCIPWIQAVADNLYIMLMKSRARSLEDKLLNLLVITFINRIIQTKQVTNSIDLVNKLNVFLSNDVNFNDATLAKNILSLSVVILERENKQIHITGFNQTIIVNDNNDIKKTELEHVQKYPDTNRHFNIVTDNISETLYVYLSTIPVENLFNSPGNREFGDNSYKEFFEKLASLTMKEQKARFEKLLEFTADILSGDDGFEIIGLRI